MVDARGGEQKRLPGRAEVGGEPGKERLAKRLGARRAARLPGADDREPQPLEALLEPPRLNRLAGALAALEGDEAASCLFGHRSPGAVPLLFQFSSNHADRNPPLVLLPNAVSKPSADGSSQHGSAPIGNEPRALGSKLDQLIDVDPNPAFGSASSNAGPCSKGVIEPAPGGSA